MNEIHVAGQKIFEPRVKLILSTWITTKQNNSSLVANRDVAACCLCRSAHHQDPDHHQGVADVRRVFVARCRTVRGAGGLTAAIEGGPLALAAVASLGMARRSWP